MDTGAPCLSAGTILKNRYELVSVIGQGSFGVTYKAVDQLLNCYVAVKECRENFQWEADVLRQARDVPYIARLRDDFSEDGTEYLVLNLIQGKTASEYVKKHGGKIPARDLLPMMQTLFETLAALHKLGLIHRDISPGNLMLSDDNILYLIDFGSAAPFGDDGVAQDFKVFRHKGLEAPEHSRPEQQGPWTDVFSLCATIVYLLTGEGTAEATDRQQFDALPMLLSRSGLSSAQQNILIKGLNPDISRRCADVQELYAGLYGKSLTEPEFTGERQVFYEARTIIGTRDRNQDNFMADLDFRYNGEDCAQAGTIECHPGEIHAVAVCDGVGGSSYGELAAKAAIQAVVHFLEQHGHGERALSERLVEEFLDQLNEKIIQLGEKIGRTATTFSLFLWRDRRYYAVNIGDSPIYLLRGRKMERLSTPHTRAELMIKMQKNVVKSDFNTLTQFLGRQGVSGSQMAAFRCGRLAPGDVVLVCSDGVSKGVGESKLKRCLAKPADKAVPAMYKILAKRDQNDNCTAVMLRF